ncbi:hypothetical protein [Corynebacterium urealyticum]|uniref:hypothetical protein n=1 Tax=Corynebacterium urealyticum TaxID=43771 RepID=UPI0011E71A01|nr:hypothetical protein [Corynebacterium urealyticum]TYR16213.1 hypothetical protein FYJ89_07025 [Corynebacterium urealyticum]TYT21744.1 hypothetical protein FYJ86_03075 [Corynebacterium urealyticum]
MPAEEVGAQCTARAARRSLPGMARLTRLPEACYSRPIRVPVGSGFTAELPEFAEKDYQTLLQLWGETAADISEVVGESGEAYRIRRLDARDYGWLELTAPAGFPPPTAMLTHPRLAQGLAERMAKVLDGVVAFYVLGERVQVCPLPLAIKRDRWHGPFDLRTGFCVAFEFL